VTSVFSDAPDILFDKVDAEHGPARRLVGAAPQRSAWARQGVLR
jgi:hypothetical protein